MKSPRSKSSFSPADKDHPFVGLKDVFGAVTLPQDNTSLHEKIRRRLAEKNGRRRRRPA
jgi:hypothetical protein